MSDVHLELVPAFPGQSDGACPGRNHDKVYRAIMMSGTRHSQTSENTLRGQGLLFTCRSTGLARRRPSASRGLSPCTGPQMRGRERPAEQPCEGTAGSGTDLHLGPSCAPQQRGDTGTPRAAGKGCSFGETQAPALGLWDHAGPRASRTRRRRR